jgi:hypothetical protein
LRAFSFDDLLKDDIVSALNEKLRSNASAYSSNPVFREFYDRTGSPIKKERQTSTALGPDDDAKPQRRRRQTIKAKDELESPYVTSRRVCLPMRAHHLHAQI